MAFRIVVVVVLVLFFQESRACFQTYGQGETQNNSHNVGIYDLTSPGHWSRSSSYYSDAAAGYTPSINDLMIPVGDGIHSYVFLPLSTVSDLSPTPLTRSGNEQSDPKLDCSFGGSLPLTPMVVTLQPFGLLPAWFQPTRFQIIIVPTSLGGNRPVMVTIRIIPQEPYRARCTADVNSRISHANRAFGLEQSRRLSMNQAPIPRGTTVTIHYYEGGSERYQLASPLSTSPFTGPMPNTLSCS